MAKLKCVFCDSKTNKILLFTQDSLKECFKIHKIRSYKGLKGSDASLPTTVNDYQGYHSKCLSTFKALPKRYKVEVIDADSSETEPLAGPSKPVDTSEEIRETLYEIENDEPHDESHEPMAESCENYPDASFDDGDSSKKVCIFCQFFRKKYQGRWLNLSTCGKEETIDALKASALEYGDVDLIKRIESSQSLENRVFYHHRCKVQNNAKYKSIAAEKRPRTSWHIKREVANSAFEKIACFVNDFIVGRLQMHSLDFLKKIYVEFLREVLEGQEDLLPETPSRFFEDRLLARFNRKIVIIKMGGKKIVKPHAGVAIHDADFAKLDKREAIALAAIYLREDVLSMKTEKLPTHVNDTDLIKGESYVPETLEFFYRSLLSGESYRRQKSTYCQRMVNSLSQDTIFAVSNGKIKTSKHITLGLAIKGLTNSKKVINILNRYGHCCSYSVLEGLETEATFSTTNQSDICPEDILRSSNLCTGVAFDNFDRFVDTNSGKDTLHDTVGIIFQNLSIERTQDHVNIVSEIIDIDSESRSSTRSSTPDTVPKRRRRTYDAVSLDLQPYLKKPKVIKNLLPLESPLRLNSGSNVTEIRGIDFAWMLSHALRLPGTPMWVGFNSLIYDDKSCQQKISYLTTINKSPTSTNVVHETMSRSLQVADECGDLYVQVTYDLAIAKVAFQLQIAENPQLDRIFIHLGTFHVMMAYFKAIGKFINNCGLTNIMVDSELLAGGSVNSFLTGKHFNRCKRLHPLMCLALGILHFRSFLNEQNVEVSEEVSTYLQEFTRNRSEHPKIDHESLTELFEKYEDYKEKTLHGDHGKTAQFFMIYSQLIHYYLMLNRSVRTSDFELLKFVLPKITNIFFIFNQHNYSRYSVLYHDNLSRVDETHPGLKEQFKMGSFGVKRTAKPFSRQPIDLTLEQTINADAGNKLTGIVHSTNSLSARQRWCKNHSMRVKIISHVMEECGLKNRQDVTADLHKNRIKKVTEQLDKFLSNMSTNIDPFASHSQKDALFNISTGRATSEESANFLLSIEENGNSLREKFIAECVEDEKRFENPIKQNKIFDFLNAEKRKIKTAGKVTEVKLQRDLFGKLLSIALEKSVDLDKVLSYPLTPIPLSFCHTDGGICKTNKSALLKKLEAEIDSSVPSRIDVSIIDGFFLLYTLKNLPATFRNVSNQILRTILRTSASTVIVSFDRYFSPSIKDTEHSLRGTMRGKQYQILGPDQERPSDFTAELKNINCKEAFVNFLIKHWENDEVVPFIGNKILFVNFASCFKYENINGKVVKSEEMNLSCPLHEESDTKIVFHACKIEGNSNVVIRCSDTDILVIMLGDMQHVSENVKIWMQVGVRNNERFINVSEIHKKLGSDLCTALPAFHALTGCDSNPALYRKGKVKPFNILRSNQEYTKAFSDMSKYPDCNFVEVLSKIQGYICELYGWKKTKTLNEARVETFMKVYKCKKNEKKLNINVRNFDGSTLPPCKSEVEQHFLRSAYIGKMWSNAYTQNLTDLTPTECGWHIEEDKLDFKWFQGDQLPNTVEEIILVSEEDDASDRTSNSEKRASKSQDDDCDDDEDETSDFE